MCFFAVTFFQSWETKTFETMNYIFFPGHWADQWRTAEGWQACRGRRNEPIVANKPQKTSSFIWASFWPLTTAATTAKQRRIRSLQHVLVPELDQAEPGHHRWHASGSRGGVVRPITEGWQNSSRQRSPIVSWSGESVAEARVFSGPESSQRPPSQWRSRLSWSSTEWIRIRRTKSQFECRTLAASPVASIRKQ